MDEDRTESVFLTTGYEVGLEEEFEGHLFKAILGESARRLRGAEDTAEEVSETFWLLCHMEIAYVAGQLRSAGDEVEISTIAEAFYRYFRKVERRVQAGKN